MRVSLNWLKQLVSVSLSPVDLAEKLTMAGFEVEEIEDRSAWAKGVVVGRVLQCEPHPQADKLKICQVDVGEGEPLTIVCGAPNACDEILVPVAKVGTFLPVKNLEIVPATKRGVTSSGMLCSLEELGLAKESEGIYIFEKDYPLGTDVRPLLGLDDVILEVASTANRADALSMIGIAREVAALTGGILSFPIADGPLIAPGSLSIAIEDPRTCPVYYGTLLEGIRVAPSPLWLQRCLEKAGMRPINNVVDITNYILLEWGQPLHAFDADLLQSDRLGVRFAENGEKLKTLDGNERSLTTTNLVITAGHQPVALAGVMGGGATEVSTSTERILLEAAIFDPATVRRSARIFGMRSEASARYERGVDNSAVEKALERAIQLLMELTGAQPVAQAKADSRSHARRTLLLRPSRFAQIMGSEVPNDQIEKVLRDLGFDVNPAEEGYLVTVPGHRMRDIEREIDLIEEVARIVGFDQFLPTLPPQTEGGYLPIEDVLLREIRQGCQGAGLTEILTYSLRPSVTDFPITLSNPLTADLTVMRTDLLDGLLQTLKYNLEQKNGPFWAFEIGTVFARDAEGVLEGEHIGGILCGDPWIGGWQKNMPTLDFFKAKGVLAAILKPWNLDIEYQADRRDERLHPGRTASLWESGERLGVFGQLHPRTAQQLDLPEATFLFELDLDVLFDLILKETATFKPFSSYPASDRDLALFARQTIPAADLERSIRMSGEALLESVHLFDEYRGTGVPEGWRSLAFRLTYRSDHTLTVDEIEKVHQQIRSQLMDRFSVELRS
jgi:phenylalanyl-tRNA synthetase beta chain